MGAAAKEAARQKALSLGSLQTVFVCPFLTGMSETPRFEFGNSRRRLSRLSGRGLGWMGRGVRALRGDWRVQVILSLRRWDRCSADQKASV